MNLSRGALWGGVAAGVGGLGLLLLAIHASMTTGYRGEGASAEQARECCERIHKVEDMQASTERQSGEWRQRITDGDMKGDAKDAWQDRRIEALETTNAEFRSLLYEMKGQLNELLRRTPAKGGPVNHSGQRIAWRAPMKSTDSIQELIDALGGGSR